MQQAYAFFIYPVWGFEKVWPMIAGAARSSNTFA
jgi:hypothetical protein